MELRQYVTLLRKWLWLVILCTVVAGVIAYVVSHNSQKIYQASATLMVNQAANPSTAAGYSDILTSERLARTYASLLVSRPVLEESAARLGISATDLKDNITVTPVRDTQLLTIKVEGPDKVLIADIANTLPPVFIEQNREMQLGRATESRANLETEIDNTQADIVRTMQALEDATDDTNRTSLETSLAQYRSTYSTLVANYQQAKLAEAQSINNIVIAEPAVVPIEPIRPRTGTNTLLAAVVGALLALGAAFLIEYLDDTVKTPDDVNRVSGLSTWARSHG